MAFFFSAISTQTLKKSTNTRESHKTSQDNGSDEEDLLSQIASNASKEWVESNPTVVNRKLSPSLSYWIALATPNGAPANPLVIHRCLLECGVEPVANQVQFFCHSLYFELYLYIH